MSNFDLEVALRLVADNHDLADFVGARREELIANAEQVLMLTLPPTYKAFLATLGAGSFGGEVFFGIIDGDFLHSGFPDAVWLTLRRREEFNLPHHLLYIYNLGDGSQYFLDTSNTTTDGECPVVVWHGVPTRVDRLEMVAADFGVFFLATVREVLQRREDPN